MSQAVPLSEYRCELNFGWVCLMKYSIHFERAILPSKLAWVAYRSAFLAALSKSFLIGCLSAASASNISFIFLLLPAKSASTLRTSFCSSLISSVKAFHAAFFPSRTSFLISFSRASSSSAVANSFAIIHSRIFRLQSCSRSEEHTSELQSRGHLV